MNDKYFYKQKEGLKAINNFIKKNRKISKRNFHIKIYFHRKTIKPLNYKLNPNNFVTLIRHNNKVSQ